MAWPKQQPRAYRPRQTATERVVHSAQRGFGWQLGRDFANEIFRALFR